MSRAIDFIFPYLADGAYVGFYGGEPLLAFEIIARSVEKFNEKILQNPKELHYTITTNGSLLTDEILAFLAQNRFFVMISFDGGAQEEQRKANTATSTKLLIRKILDCPEITLTVNSVFTPSNLPLMADSVRMIRELGVSQVTHVCDSQRPWKKKDFQELSRQMKKMRREYLKSGIVSKNKQIQSTMKKTSVFACYAGRDRFSLSADGKIWGCFMFGDFFRQHPTDEEYVKFCFGSLDEFILHHRKIYPKIAANYRDLRQDYFYTDRGFCFECNLIHSCSICPITSRMGGSLLLEKVPSTLCRISRSALEEGPASLPKP